MKKILGKTLVVAFILTATSFSSKAQCDTIAKVCAKHIIASFISDGQQYRSLLLNPDETAEFKTTFFGETVYRIAACSGLTDGNLIFNVYDQERNIIFTNSGSGCAVLLIGFKQSKK